jgi:LysM repeat protein/uncharacterized protein YcbK (DUF882 family)
MRRILLTSLVCLCLGALSPSVEAAPAGQKPRVHVVYSGQRLASIARRYNVSVEALCNANGLSASDPIKPGQKLLVPPAEDKDGSRTRAGNVTVEQKPLTPPKAEAESKTSPALPRTHKVEPGQRLGSIAKRYGVTVEALCSANGIKPSTTLKPGQVLTLPGTNDQEPRSRRAEESPLKAVSPDRAGYLEIYNYNARWRGRVVDRKGKLSPAAVSNISRLLGATGERPRLDQRLIRLLVQVSDAFGGRPIRIVSGYRTASFYEDSRHKLSRAVDFSIPGVSNTTLRDYLRRFSNVGVGYYPNSSFVHLDVREGAAYWVDYAGPGEAPRSRPDAPRKKLAADDHDHREGDSGSDGEVLTDESTRETRPATLIREPEPIDVLPPLM